MIKARFQVKDRSIILIGLSGENVTRLVAGEPIHFLGSEVGVDNLEFIITYGRTEEDIKADLSKELGIRL